MKLPFVLSCGIQFHSCRWSNILIRKQSLGQLGSFPSSPALSYLLPSTREKRESTEVGELTCLSDSLLCSRIIFLQPAAYWLCDIFTKSDLATDLNAKWTLRPWTTFYLGVCLLLSNLRAMRILSPLHILPDPIDLFWRSPWQRKDEPGGLEEGPRQWRTCETINQWADIQVWLCIQRGLVSLSKLKWVMYYMYQHAKDTALSPRGFDVLLTRLTSIGSGKNILQFLVMLGKISCSDKRVLCCCREVRHVWMTA